LYDEHAGDLKIIASGSSAFYLDDRFKDSLAGRKRIFQLLTCSFDEYLEMSGKVLLVIEKNRLLQLSDAKSTQMDFLRVEWENYMIFGGYPAVITEPDKSAKINLLKEIRDSFIKRDILEAGVVNEIAFYHLFRILAAQTGNLVNVNELSLTLRIKNETVSNYLNVMQKCFHISLPKPSSRNLRKELVKMPKVYLLDTGLRNCLLNNFQPLALRTDKGELWENTVFRLLINKYGLDSVLYWRTSAGNEVDFVIPDMDEAKAIEAKYDIAFTNQNKCKLFHEAYPEIKLQFAWMYPMDESFFRRIDGL
jgi:predicted AAA+ superfamily ATPase